MERTDLEQWKAKEVARLLAFVGETERRYYQEMVAMLPVPLVVLSEDRGVSCESRIWQTFNLKSKDMRGKTIEQILPSDRLIENIREVYVTGVPQTAFDLEHNGRRFTVGI